MAGNKIEQVAGQARVLITGFAPFDKDPINSSWEVARRFNRQSLGSAILSARQLPCEFNRSREVLAKHLRALKPHLILCLGQANTRNDVSIERVAININDARMADNAGARPIDTAVVRGGPVAYFSTLPIKAITQAIRQANIPASVSQSAGTYVCNHLFYGLMHLLATQHPTLRGGFIHLPPLPAQAARLPGTSSMSLDTMLEAIRIATVTSLRIKRDLRLGGGALD